MRARGVHVVSWRPRSVDHRPEPREAAKQGPRVELREHSFPSVHKVPVLLLTHDVESDDAAQDPSDPVDNVVCSSCLFNT